MPANHHSEGPAVVVDDLVVRRGRREVLPGVSLTVRRGVVTGLVGPSGSGKTTLLRAIVGVQVVHGGTVQVLGRPAGSPPLRHLVAYATQGASVYGDLTVAQNLEHAARILRVPPDRIEAALRTVGLLDHAGQVVGTLSGGERSRTSLAVALLGHPEVLVLDEPTVGLDPVLRRDLWATFRSLAEGGVAVLVSTHVMDEADRCDELVLLREGRVVAAEPPQRLRERTGASDLEGAFLALAEAGA
jgi:ABC-2 type transport system ATP-binding protein